MTDKERLTNIIHNAQNKYLNLLKFESSILADYLLANGVILQKQGEWVSCGIDNNDMEIIKCSECGRKQFGYSKFCATCGAKMNERDKK